jgi:hypothetical protein
LQRVSKPVFSANPGCWERHLQRKAGNPLFSDAERQVSQAQVDAARRKDREEAEAFEEAFRALVKEAMELPPRADSAVILSLKERTDKLYECCAGLGGDLRAHLDGLKRLAGIIMRAVWEGAGDDAKARWELEREENARALHFELLRHPVVADLLRPDSPIAPQQLVPVLLCEREEALRAVLALFDEVQLAELRSQAREMLSVLAQDGHELPAAWRGLAVLEGAGGARN